MRQILLRSFIVCLFIFSAAVPPHAQITLDGTVGTAGKMDLPGPNYEIGADYGQQAGANLFHSFQQFNIGTDEIATFRGPASIQNIISRVTGGDASMIDGTLRSAIDGADMYLMNPAGVMFGPNATLDVSGSFHISTADYLRLGESDRFYAEPLAGEVLSVSSPAAFGFLDGEAAPVSFEGHGELSTDIWDEDYGTWWNWLDYNKFDYGGLEVPDGGSISVTGGKIDMAGTYFRDKEGVIKAVGTNLRAPGGEISLTAISSQGEVAIAAQEPMSGISVPASCKGEITLSDGAVLNTEKSFGSSGSIFVRGGRFAMDNNSEIISEKAILSQGAPDIDGVIAIQAEEVFVGNGSRISGETKGTGKGTDISIIASEEVSIVGGTLTNSSSYDEGPGAGDGGKLSIEAKRINISTDSWLGGESYGTGRGGDTTLEASESVRVSDYALITTSAKQSVTGQGGDITINSPKLTVETGAVIESRSEGSGRGGNIEMNVRTLDVTDEGKISLQAMSSGHGGNLTVSGPDPAKGDDFADSVTISGPSTGMQAGTSGPGKAGTISIHAGALSVTNEARIATSASHTGDAGAIMLNVGTLDLASSGSVSSASEYPEARVHTVADPSELENLSAPQIGDIVIVRDAGDGESATAILDAGNYWVILTGEVFQAEDMAELDTFIDPEYPEYGEGHTVAVRNAGDGKPASFVYNGFLAWVRISKLYTVTDIGQRDAFPAFPGDVARIENMGNPEHVTFTGREWIPAKAVHSVGSLSERDILSVRKGDVAKVADAGNGAAESFIFDGEGWISFYMTGNAGTIAVRADEAVTLADDAVLTTSSSGGVSAGEISIDAEHLHVGDSASVSSTSSSVGDAGTIQIHSEKTVILDDDAAITSATFGQGRAGDIETEASEITFSGASRITSASENSEQGGPAGTVFIQAGDLMRMGEDVSVTTSTEGTGRAGDITVAASNIELEGNATVSSESRATENGGDAGMITLNADDSLKLSGKSALTTEASGAGGGKIFVNAGNRIYLLGTDITSSVKQGGGKGGDVTTNSKFVIINEGNITANAEDGDGGAIFIVTDNYLKSSYSKVSATSRRGNDGIVRIEAPDTDISGDLVILPGTILDATQWLRESCSERSGEKASRFLIRGRDAAPTALDGWPSPPRWFGDSASDDEQDGEELKGSEGHLSGRH